MKILIVIPTYNERENIERLLGRLLNVRPDLEILVVDDNSPDGTGELVKNFTKDYPRIHLLERAHKQGIGPAYLAGFKWALENGFEYICEMDADLSHRPRYLPRFFEEINNADIVVGSRYTKNGRLCNWPLRRILLSRIANLYAKLVLQTPVDDMTAGFICYRRKALEALNLDEIQSDGYSFQIEMKYRAMKKGFKIIEVPITFTDRKIGNSKISKRICIEALIIVLKLKFFFKEQSPSKVAETASSAS